MRKIIAIKANTDPVRYVTTTHNRPDGQVAVELSDNKNLAHDFGTEENAEMIIPKIVNPWNRVYKSVKTQVNQPKQIEFSDHLN